MNQPAKTSPAVSFDEIRQLVKNDLPLLQDAEPPPGLGDMTTVWSWLATAQGRGRPLLRHPRIALFATAGAGTQLEDIRNGRHPVNSLAEEANADLQVYELASNNDAPGQDDIAHALAYGMMAMQPGIDLLVIAALDPAAEKTGEALIEKLESAEPLSSLSTLDIAAMTGALIAARLAKAPVLLEGTAALAAAAVLEAMNEAASLHARNAAEIPLARTSLPLPCRAAMLVPFLKTITKI